MIKHRRADLIDGDKDGHAGRLSVGDGLDGLRPHAVIGGHHHDRYVSHPRAPRPHCAERLQIHITSKSAPRHAHAWIAPSRAAPPNVACIHNGSSASAYHVHTSKKLGHERMDESFLDGPHGHRARQVSEKAT